MESGHRTIGPMAKQTAARRSTRGGMGAVPFDGGVTFRVWAPHADAVSVVGSFNDWDSTRDSLAPDEGGNWSADVGGAGEGDEYKFLIRTGEGELIRIDPACPAADEFRRQRDRLRAGGFDWGDMEFRTPDWNDLVIYELHVGTFSEGMHGRPGTLNGVQARLEYLRNLGVGRHPAHAALRVRRRSVVGLQPGPSVCRRDELRRPGRAQGARQGRARAGHRGPARRRLQPPRAVRSRPVAVRRLVRGRQGRDLLLPGRPVHRRRGARRGPTTAGRRSARSFATTPSSGSTSSGSTACAGMPRRTSRASPAAGTARPTGSRTAGSSWPRSTSEMAERYPGPPDDRRGHAGRPGRDAPGGRGGRRLRCPMGRRLRDAVRAALVPSADEERDVAAVARTLVADPADAFKRVIYTESHDEDANGGARVPEEVWPGYADSWASKKRATLGSALVMTRPGIPMLFQGQELVEGSWFARRRRARLEPAPSPRRPVPAPPRPDQSPSQRRG